ncbi:hypothetical protein [Nocardia bovistercoris]|uniref:Uncharacterized protein n=1 Tax=Nocardia bovistercoris TaxID=2785916 RepID=A0A931IAL4_9NOCA|nr:hypothetical protein [Nocardia bovistercoris]MBH0776953.1 hypothetical protein [Nocardia bovistercoris]
MRVSSHGSVHYLRCVCGQWLASHRGGVSPVSGVGACLPPPGDHLELIPLPEE